MQNIIIDTPYRFIPARPSRLWPALVKPLIPGNLRKNYGVTSFEMRGLERLQASVAAGDGVLLAPNHCRPSDPIVAVWLGLRAGHPVYIMASRHLFEQTRFQSFLLPRVGAFSVHREGMDRESLKFAIGAIGRAERPVVIFPEGVVTRTTDRLSALQEGIAFMARNAARQRAAAAPGRRVVIHPVALRYFFRGDLEAAVIPVLERIEARLSWRPQRGLPLLARIEKIGETLLALKEIEYFGKPQSEGIHQRRQKLIDVLLSPLEREYLSGRGEGDVVARVKNLRGAILPGMIEGTIDGPERAHRWDQLAATYLAQQVHFYPAGYFDEPPTTEQILETVERFEEDLTDTATVHHPLHLVAEVGEAIEVTPARERGGAGGDPLMARLREALETMLARLKAEQYPRNEVPCPTPSTPVAAAPR